MSLQKYYNCPYCNSLIDLVNGYCEHCWKYFSQQLNNKEINKDNWDKNVFFDSYYSFCEELENKNDNKETKFSFFDYWPSMIDGWNGYHEIFPENLNQLWMIKHYWRIPWLCWHCKKNKWDRDSSHRIIIHKVLKTKWASLRTIEKTYKRWYVTIPCCNECKIQIIKWKKKLRKILFVLWLVIWLLIIFGSYQYNFPYICHDKGIFCWDSICSIFLILIVGSILYIIINFCISRYKDFNYPVYEQLEEEWWERGTNPWLLEF